jgi:hypothetical protein
MSNLAGVIQQLKVEHDRLSREIRGVAAALAAFGDSYRKGPGGRGQISAAGRARISAAQKARWAKVKGTGGPSAKVATTGKKRTMSAAARKRIAAAQRARWAKVRAAKA